MASPGTPVTTKARKATSPHAAPPAAIVPASGTANSLAQDLYGLSSQGIGDLANVPIQGAYEFFGQPAYTPGKTITGPSRASYPTPFAPMTAQQAIAAFVHLTGAQLAQVQDQLYRGGFYSQTYVPSYGQIKAEDLSAFRQAMIGLASNPTQGTLTDYLSRAAQLGDTQGINTKKRAPLVVRLTNPDDLRVTLQKTAQDLYGGNLPEDDVQRFISAFQATQATSQTQSYAMSGYNPDTGQQDFSGATPTTAGGTVTSAASPSSAAESFIRTQHPDQVAVTAFGNAMNPILDTLRQSA